MLRCNSWATGRGWTKGLRRLVATLYASAARCAATASRGVRTAATLVVAETAADAAVLTDATAFLAVGVLDDPVVGAARPFGLQNASSVRPDITYHGLKLA